MDKRFMRQMARAIHDKKMAAVVQSFGLCDCGGFLASMRYWDDVLEKYIEVCPGCYMIQQPQRENTCL